MSNRRVPFSLADLKRKRDEEESKAARPVFLTKEQRQKAALARLEKKVASEKEEIRKKREVDSSRRGAPSNRESSSRDPRVTKRPRYTKATRMSDVNLDKQELDAIRNHYMHIPSRRAPPSSKTKTLRYEWDAADDTMANEDAMRKALRAKAVAVHRPKDFFQNRRVRPTSRTAYLQDHRHWSEKPRSEMTDRDWRIFREDYVITVRATNAPAPNPARSWDETGLPRQLLRLVRDVARYEKPSPIQMASIPIGLERRDCIGLAETGSGKTAAFVLPMLVHISNMPRMTLEISARGPYALVLAPTRELALQIEAEATKFAAPLGYRVVHVIGGQSLDAQATELQEGCEIVVCTPGRMVDLLSRQMAALGNCNYLILDEADRMIDMGFEPQLSEILDSMPLFDPKSRDRRQTFMFSATMTPPVERIAKTYLHDPIIISVGETGKAADNVNQRVEFFPTENRRRHRFVELLETLQPPILVFVNTKGGCEMVSRFVESNSSVRTVIMHSGKSQDQREKTLEGFKSGRHKVLIATDVVGRGIDIKGVRNVVNFELPRTIEAYTHRVGRTGRAGEKGNAWSLAMEGDVEMFGPLTDLLELSGARVPREIAAGAARGSKGFQRPITD